MRKGKRDRKSENVVIRGEMGLPLKNGKVII
jgi:hypothetical protein